MISEIPFISRRIHWYHWLADLEDSGV